LAPVPESVITPTVAAAPELTYPAISESVITPTVPAGDFPALPSEVPQGIQDTVKRALTRWLTPQPHPPTRSPGARPGAPGASVEAQAPQPAGGLALALGAGIVIALLGAFQ
jgi:hypothetical protein